MSKIVRLRDWVELNAKTAERAEYAREAEQNVAKRNILAAKLDTSVMIEALEGKREALRATLGE